MDKEQISKRLEEERARLERLAHEIDREGVRDHGEEDAISELTTADQHPADVGSETFERAKQLSTLEQIEAELEDVERAFDRLERGEYGICEICGRPIGEERLQALPATRYCVEDQSKIERAVRSPAPE